MLIELLALHEETLAQLRLKRLGSSEAVDLLTGMIDQHENAARRLRAQLDDGPGSGEPSQERAAELQEAS